MPEAVPLPLRNSAVSAMAIFALVLAGAGAGCHPKPSRADAGGGAPGASPGPGPEANPVSHRPTREPQARQMAQIPGGTLRAGSTPGDPGRVPELEAKNLEVELGPFAIDRLPYPNDPTEPALLGKTRDDARRLCAEKSARLCTEVEWERACKGPRQDEYPSGVMWDPSCTAGA